MRLVAGMFGLGQDLDHNGGKVFQGTTSKKRERLCISMVINEIPTLKHAIHNNHLNVLQTMYCFTRGIYFCLRK